MSELQGLLDCLSEEASLDSQGRFTLDFQRAAEPLGAFVREHPAWPWLRLIQVAHQQRAESIHITIRRDTLQFRFRAARWAQDWLTVGQWLQGKETLPQRTAVGDVLLGMSASAALEWKVGLDDPELQSLRWQRQRALEVSGQAGDSATVVVLARFQAPGWFGWRKNPLSDIHANLAQRCALAPIRIEVDEFAINDPNWRGLPGVPVGAHPEGSYDLAGESLHWPSDEVPFGQRMAALPPQILSPACTLLPQAAPLYAESAYLKKTICLALNFAGEAVVSQVAEGQPLPPTPRLALYASGPFSHETTFVSGNHNWILPQLTRSTALGGPDSPEAPLVGVMHRLIVPLNSDGPAQLILVRDGLVSDPVVCPSWPPGLLALTCDPRLSTDASGLKIVQNDALLEVAMELKQLAQPLLTQIQHMLDPLHPLLDSHLSFHEAFRLHHRLSGLP